MPRRSIERMARAVLAVSLALLPLSVHANETFPPLGKIAGVEIDCRDFKGASVRVVSIANLGDVGRAGVVNRVPIIAMDPRLLETLPPKLQLFFYGHECAHHVLGHVYAFSLTRETEADCWSIKNGRDRALFSREDVEGFAPHLARSGGSSWGHMPGTERAKFLLKCFDER